MKADPRFIRGIELFNKKEYFECHESIEALWLETPPDDPYRDLYKGVIQAAAAFYQFDRAIYSGAFGLYRTAVSNLEQYRPGAIGFKVDPLIEGLHKVFKPLVKWTVAQKAELRVKPPNFNKRMVPKLTIEMQDKS